MMFRRVILSGACGAVAFAVALCALAGPAAAQETSGKWHIDRFDERGTKGAVVWMYSRLPLDGWPGNFIPRLVVRCTGAAPTVFVVTGRKTQPEPGKDRQFTVHYHLDDARIAHDVWGQTTASDTLVASDSHAFLQKLLAAKRLRFEFTPDQGELEIVEFPLVGLRSELAKVSDVCESGS